MSEHENGDYRAKNDDRKLFVVGLSWWTREQGLNDYFGKFGKVETINVKAGCGFCSIVFKDISSVDAVLNAGEHFIDGKKVDLKKFKTDCKRKSRSRSRSPHKRRWRKSPESQTEEKESVSRSNSCKTSLCQSSLSSSSTFSTPVSSTTLSSNIPESPSESSSSLTSHCESSFENNPILNGLPDGVRSQFDAQWKYTTQYNHHRTEFDEYPQDLGPYKEYDKKRHAFIQMLEKQKTNAPQKEKNNLWNQVWKVVLNNSDEEKQPLKKAQKNVDSSHVENKLTTQYSRHQPQYDKYHQNPGPHDEYDQKRHSFMQMLEKQKTNAPEKEKINLWNQFWKVVLNNSDDENVTLKNVQKNIDSTPVEKNPVENNPVEKNIDSSPVEKNPVENNPVEKKHSSFRNCSNKASHKKGSSLFDLKKTIQVKKEPLDIVDIKRIKVKEEKIDPIENIATRVNVESNIKIENNMELDISINKEPSFDFGSDDQLDPEMFLKDLDKLSTEYVAVGVEQDEGVLSNSSKRMMNPEFHGGPSERISPKFHPGIPQEIYFNKETNANEDYSTSEKQFGGSKEDPFLNVETKPGMVRSEGLPNHQTDNTTTGTTSLDISQKEKQIEDPQEFYLKKERNANEDYSTIVKRLGGSKGDPFYNVNTEQGMFRSEGFPNHQTDSAITGTTALNISQKEEQDEDPQEFYFNDSFFNFNTGQSKVRSEDSPKHLSANRTTGTALDISQKEKQTGDPQEFYFNDSFFNVNTGQGKVTSECSPKYLTANTTTGTTALDISQKEKQIGDPPEFIVNDSFFNVNTGQGMIRSEGIPNHQTSDMTTKTTVIDISQKDKQSETFKSNIKVKDALNTIQNLSNRLSLFAPPLNNCINKMKNQSTDSVKEFELAQDKQFLLILRDAAAKFEKESAKINNEIVKCLSKMGKKEDSDLSEYDKSKQNICIHGVDIEKIAKRTIYKTSEECKQFIENAIMYETKSSNKPSEDIVKEIFNKVSALNYNMIKGGVNKGINS